MFQRLIILLAAVAAFTAGLVTLTYPTIVDRGPALPAGSDDLAPAGHAAERSRIEGYRKTSYIVPSSSGRIDAPIAAWQHDLYSEDRVTRLIAAQALHPYITNGWVPAPYSPLSKEQIDTIIVDVWYDGDPPVVDVFNDGHRPNPPERSASAQTLLTMSRYFAMRCGVPFNDFTIRQTRWTREFMLALAIQVTIKTPTAELLLQEPEAVNEIIGVDATPCTHFDEMLAFG